MKILFLAHRIPYPPNKGDKLRAFNFIKHLSKDHEIYLGAFFDDKEDGRYEQNLREYCREVHLCYLNPFFSKLKAILWMALAQPATLGYFHSSRFLRKIREIEDRVDFDAVFVYSSSMAQYVPASGRALKVIDFVDCDSAKWAQYGKSRHFPSSLIFALEHRLLRRYEKSLIEKFDKILVTTEIEMGRFKEFASTDKFTVINNGVDHKFFSPVDPATSDSLIFTGAMDYYANIDGITIFCSKVLPIIQREVPGTKLYIVGPRPGRSVIALEKLPGVIVTGFVEDLREYFRKAAVCVVPSFRIAAGIQNKILEAMASGIPVVTTQKAAACLNAKDGSEIMIADSEETFAEKVITLLKKKELRRSVGSSGRVYVLSCHSWERSFSELDGVLGKK